MKNFAKLMIFFSVNYAITFVVAILLGFISFWVSSTRIIPVAGAGFGGDFAEVFWTAISAAMYFSILITLGYSARNKLSTFHSIFIIAAIAFAFTAGISLAAHRFEALRPAFTPVSPVRAAPGLMLSRLENTIILLTGGGEAAGPRLVSIPGQPFIYQETPVGPNNTILGLPPLPLGSTSPWFIRSIGIDFSLSAAELRTLYEANLLYFGVYALCLILFLSSLRFLLELSNWPLANIFFAAFIFRLILSLEIFLNSGEINTLIESFLGERLPSAFITPSAFAAFAILTILYTILA